MIASLLIHKERRHLEQLQRRLAATHAAIARDKRRLRAVAEYEMRKPYAIGASFAAGCVAELVIERGHVPSFHWFYRVGMLAAQLW